MTRSNRKRAIIAVATAASAVLLLPAAGFAGIVFDPSNFAEAVVQVADDVQLVEQFKQEIQNEVAMLKSWNFTELSGIVQNMATWQKLFGAAGTTYSSTSPGSALDSQYPSDPSHYAGTSDSAMQSMRSGWQQAERSVLVENRTVQNQTYLSLKPTAQRMDDYIQHSNGAPGATAAIQAGNEELATLVAQIQSLQAQEVSDTRREVQQDAQRQAERAYAQQQQQLVRGDWDNPQQPSASLVNAFPMANQ